METERITLLDSNNKKVTVDVIRFFEYNNNQYLIYTLNEVDQKGYIKLYLVKIISNSSEIKSVHVSNHEEWLNIQKLLEHILKQIKYGMDKSFVDLDVNILNNLKINQVRVFKFNKNLVELLSRKNTSIDFSMDIPINNNVPNNNTNHFESDSIDYKSKYLESQKEIDELNNVLGKLLNDNIRYELKYGKLPEE